MGNPGNLYGTLDRARRRIGKEEKFFLGNTRGNNMQKTTITLENGYGTYTVSVNRQDMGIDEVVEELVQKVLLAAGYGVDAVNKSLGD